MRGLANRVALTSGQSLPYDAEVEYLTASDGSYIETGVPFLPLNWAFETEVINDNRAVLSIGTSHDGIPGGTWIGTPWGKTDWCLFGNYSAIIRITDSAAGDVLKFDCLSGAYINGTKKGSYTCTTGNDSVAGFTVKLFRSYRFEASIWGGSGTCKWLKFYRNGVLAFDFIPVRKGTVGYMYDRVSKQLFGNAGTGAFIVGPDKT